MIDKHSRVFRLNPWGEADVSMKGVMVNGPSWDNNIEVPKKNILQCVLPLSVVVKGCRKKKIGHSFIVKYIYLTRNRLIFIRFKIYVKNKLRYVSQLADFNGCNKRASKLATVSNNISMRNCNYKESNSHL